MTTRPRAGGAAPGRRLRAALAGTALTLLAACGHAPGAGDDARLRVGDQNGLLRQLLAVSGVAPKVASSVEWTTFADGPHMNAAFIAGAVDLGWMGDTPTLLASAARADIVVLTARPLPANSYIEIIARPGLGIATLADLRGRRIALTKGTASQGFLDLALERAGLKQRDVTIVDVPGVATGNALASGSADAAVLAGPVLTNYIAAHPDAVELKAVDPQYLLLAASRKALADPARRKRIEDLVIALDRAGSWTRLHPAAWRKAYFGGELHQGEAALKVVDRRAVTLSVIGPVDGGLIDALRRQQRLLGETGIIPGDRDLVTPLFDPTINRQFNRLLADNAR